VYSASTYIKLDAAVAAAINTAAVASRDIVDDLATVDDERAPIPDINSPTVISPVVS
jgi:hypothetical protein